MSIKIYIYVIPELTFCMVHFLKRIIQRDLPELEHQNASTCHCQEAIDICFRWIIDMDELITTTFIKKYFNLKSIINAMKKDTDECCLISLQKKYHFLCCAAFGTTETQFRWVIPS